MSNEFILTVNKDLRLIQRQGGLTFGTDAYLLAAFTKSSPHGHAVELGGGSGIVSLLCAARSKYSSILSVELQEVYADLIRRNAELNGLNGIVSALHKDVRTLTVHDTGGEVDAVFSNPPYLSTGSGKVNESEEMRIARREENGTIRDFSAAAARILRWGGTFTVVFRPERITELLVSLRIAGLEPKRMVTVHPTPSAPPSLVLVEAKKGAGEGLLFSRPLIIYRAEEKSVYTDDMQAVYNRFTLSHLF